MKKTKEPVFERIEILDFETKEVVQVTLSMLCAHVRMKGTIYFQYVQGGTIYKLQAIEKEDF